MNSREDDIEKIRRNLANINNRQNERKNKRMSLNAQCYVCRATSEERYMINVKDAKNITRFYVCDMCHCALWHEYRGDEVKIYQELMSLKKKRSSIIEETNDKARDKRDPISIEDVVELAWQLTFDQNKWWVELEKQGKLSIDDIKRGKDVLDKNERDFYDERFDDEEE